MPLTIDGTSEAVAEIAEYICGLFKQTGPVYWGASGVVNGVPFNGKAVSMCSYFVHRCNWASAGHDLPLDFGGTADETELDMMAQGLKATVPHRGYAVCFNANTTSRWGHIGIDLGDGLHYAANTCSKAQGGPGYAISTYDVIGRGRISGYYQVLPARAAQVVKVIGPGGIVVDCQPLMTGQRMAVAALPFLAVMGVSPHVIPVGIIHEDTLRAFVAEIMILPSCAGWSAKYEQTADGPRLYLRKA
jgi:hypothetical protein